MAVPTISYIGLTILFLDIIVTGVLTLFLMKKYFNTRIVAVLILSVFYFVDILTILIEVPRLLMNLEDPYSFYLASNNPIILIFSLLGIVSAGIFLLFIDYFEKDRISLRHSIVYVAFLATFLMYSYYEIRYGVMEILIPGLPMGFGFLPVFFLTYVTVAALYSLFRMRGKSEDKRQTRQINLMILAIIFYYVNTSIFISVGLNIEILLTNDWMIMLQYFLPRLSVLIGDVLIFYSYALARTAYLQLKHMEKLLVINKGGLPLLSYDFTPSGNGDDDILLSGGLTAISQLLSETIKVSEIELIQFKEKDVLINQMEDVGIFLICDQPTRFLRGAMKRFGIQLSNNYELSNANNIEKIDEKYVIQSFGY